MTCDHCGAVLHQDSNGWFVGEDETSDCPDAPEDGHEVDGRQRA